MPPAGTQHHEGQPHPAQTLVDASGQSGNSAPREDLAVGLRALLMVLSRNAPTLRSGAICHRAHRTASLRYSGAGGRGTRRHLLNCGHCLPGCSRASFTVPRQDPLHIPARMAQLAPRIKHRSVPTLYTITPAPQSDSKTQKRDNYFRNSEP